MPQLVRLPNSEMTKAVALVLRSNHHDVDLLDALPLLRSAE